MLLKHEKESEIWNPQTLDCLLEQPKLLLTNTLNFWLKKGDMFYLSWAKVQNEGAWSLWISV